MKYLKYFESIDLTNFDQKALIKIIEYVYYNNISDEEDYITISEIPKWILTGSKKYLNSKNITEIYRGENDKQHEAPFSWTYNKTTAESFGKNIITKNVPDNVICPEYIVKLIKERKLNLNGIVDSDALDYFLLNTENEVIIPLI